MKQIFSAILFIGFAPSYFYAQTPVLIPPAIFSGPVYVTTADLLGISLFDYNASSAHALQVNVTYSPGCADGYAPFSFLEIPELKLDDQGRIEQGVLPEYDASWHYENGEYQEAINQTGYLPSGCYEVCYRYVDLAEGITADACIQFQIFSDFPFYLLTPFDESTVEDYYPIFTWTPYGEAMDVKYRLTLSELYEGQSDVEAFQYNTPRLVESGLFSTFLQYPVVAAPLEPCRKYAWGVEVIQNDFIVKTSEIWQFNTPCDASADPEIATGQYHVLTDDQDKILFTAVGDTLRFRFHQPYDKIENYKVSILSLSTGTEYSISPVIELTSEFQTDAAMDTGDQQLYINLVEAGIIPEDYYLLVARNQNNTYYLHFLYHLVQ